MTKKVTKTKKKDRRSIPHGKVKVQATFNNTIISITEPNGNVLGWSSAGAQGFKGSKKSTPFAAQMAAEKAARGVMEAHGLRSVDVDINGPGAGREATVRALQSVGLRVNIIRDITPIPHNGCRPSKRRRV